MPFVVGFCGSPRKGANTSYLVKEVLAGAAAAGAETRFHDLNDPPVHGCQACMACKEESHFGRCAHHDAFEAMNQDILRADGIVFGAPVYIGYWSGQAKSFIDRWYCFRSRAGWHFPPGKRALMICTCGAQTSSYQDLLDRQVAWMRRIGMDAQGLMAAGLSGKDAARGRAELGEQARSLGPWLAGGQPG
jgi:multimeric flavodoxin WrbA